MVLILSRQDDGSTLDVIEWLISFKKKYIRIDSDNDRTKFVYYNIEDNKLVFSQNGKEINLLKRTSLWYRRSGFSTNSLDRNNKTYEREVFLRDHNHQPHIQLELKALFDFIHYSLEKSCNVLGNYKKAALNKMEVLNIAKEKGMKIPLGFIVTKKEHLIHLIKNNKKNTIITKALGEGVYKITKKYGYYSYTERLTLKNVTTLPDNFFPSLIQLEIKKKLELRVFYLKENFYSMAIFSQQDKTTATDFRKYNQKKPNRTIPYLLPDDIKKKLVHIFNELSLNTGSVDLLVDEGNDYVFLEINPIGQFSMTSLPCNYYLEKKIAQIL